MNGRSLAEIAAFQWDRTYRTVLDDLSGLPRDRWTAVSYAELTSATAATIRRLCAFAGIEFDSALAQRVSGPLPLSRYTLAPPDPEKWRQHEAEIEAVLPSVEETWQRLRGLSQPPNL
jgi:hypothetical protein